MNQPVSAAGVDNSDILSSYINRCLADICLFLQITLQNIRLSVGHVFLRKVDTNSSFYFMLNSKFHYSSLPSSVSSVSSLKSVVSSVSSAASSAVSSTTSSAAALSSLICCASA